MKKGGKEKRKKKIEPSDGNLGQTIRKKIAPSPQRASKHWSKYN